MTKAIPTRSSVLLAGYAKRLIRWDSLRQLGENRLLQSSYIWLLIVPAGAKLLEQVKSPVELAPGLVISLELPFSWYELYFAALCFVFGNIIYAWRCPSFIKRYGSLKDWVASNETFAILQAHAEIDEYWYPPEEQEKHRPDRPAVSAPHHILKRFTIDGEALQPELSNPEHDDVARLFHWLFSRQNKRLFWYRLSCALAYLAGFFALLSVFLENMLYVLNSYLDKIL